MSTTPKPTVVDLRAATYARLRAEATRALRDPRVSLDDKEAAMDKAIAFDRATLKQKIARGEYGEPC